MRGLTSTQTKRGAAIRGSILGAALVAVNCFPPVEVTPPPADAPAELLAMTGASVFIGAGDIAVCGTTYDEQTARIVDSVSRADSAAKVEDVVFTVGDNVYPNGAKINFDRCWSTSWGDTAKRIMRWLRPTVGNHDLDNGFGEAYYELFGKNAGEKGKGYYAYDLGEWKIVALNSEIVTHPAFSPEARRDQEAWLKKELEGNTKKCTIAYFHRPRFSSGGHSGDLRMTGVWNLLYEGNVDLVLSGHDHHYERFAPQTPAGLRDTTRGIPEIIIGTGGADLTGVRNPVRPNSIVQIVGHHGVLKLTLGAGEYQHAFLDINGRIWDRSAGKCH